MRAKPWKEVLGAMEKRTVIPDAASGAFTPIADGKVVFADVAKRRSEGNFIKAVRLPFCSLFLIYRFTNPLNYNSSLGTI
jgi:hypothetical protein